MSEKTRATRVAVTKADTRVMYVGPTYAPLGIQNTVYSDLPPNAMAAIATTPIYGRLFLPLSQYPIAERQIREESGAIWDAYKAALEAAANAARTR